MRIVATSFIGPIIHLLNQLDLARPPAFVEEWLQRAVEPQNREPPLAGEGLDPVALFTRRHFRPKVHVD